jgi:hypothetical protein
MGYFSARPGLDGLAPDAHECWTGAMQTSEDTTSTRLGKQSTAIRRGNVAPPTDGR